MTKAKRRALGSRLKATKGGLQLARDVSSIEGGGFESHKKSGERKSDEPACRVCGCTEDNACEGGCTWVEEDLCSACVGKEKGRQTQTARRRRAREGKKATPCSPEGHYRAEARCVVCGHEEVVESDSTSGAIRFLRALCVRGKWRTLLLPSGRIRGGPSRRRVMVCPRCYGQLRVVSARSPVRRAIAFDVA